MFWENFFNLCNKKGESPNTVAKNIGLSSATVTKWKNGSIPRPSAIKKVSEYFNVTVEELLAEDEPKIEVKEKSPTEEDERMSEFAKLFLQFSEEEQRFVIAQMKGIIDMKEKK